MVVEVFNSPRPTEAISNGENGCSLPLIFDLGDLTPLETTEYRPDSRVNRSSIKLVSR